MNNAGANTVTLLANSVVAFPVGACITITQTGAGQTTIVAGSGVTINTPSTLKTRAQFSTVSLVQKKLDVWTLMGDMA
jgi:hypothetical protein